MILPMAVMPPPCSTSTTPRYWRARILCPASDCASGSTGNLITWAGQSTARHDCCLEDLRREPAANPLTPAQSRSASRSGAGAVGVRRPSSSSWLVRPRPVAVDGRGLDLGNGLARSSPCCRPRPWRPRCRPRTRRRPRPHRESSPSRSRSAATRHHASSICWPLSNRDDGCGASAVWTNASRSSFLPTPGMLDRTRRRVLDLHLDERLERPAHEREPPRDAPEDDDADRVDVRLRPDPLGVLELLGRHVAHRAEQVVRARQAPPLLGDLLQAGDAEVDQLHVPARSRRSVSSRKMFAGLMSRWMTPAAWQSRTPTRSCSIQFDEPVERDPPLALQEVGERLAVEALEDEEGLLLLVAEPEHLRRRAGSRPPRA